MLTSFTPDTIAFLEKLISTRRHLLNKFHTPEDEYIKTSIRELSKTLAYNKKRFSDQGISQFVVNNYNTISHLVPGEGSGCHEDFTQRLMNIRNTALKNLNH